jgi:aryl-alcohol dehydrogenase-like predicted oxidoreductase
LPQLHLPGKAIKGCREKFIVATKCGIVKTDSGLIFDGSRKHVREACEASLKRLGTDYIDLYYLHRYGLLLLLLLEHCACQLLSAAAAAAAWLFLPKVCKVV